MKKHEEETVSGWTVGLDRPSYRVNNKLFKIRNVEKLRHICASDGCLREVH